MRAFLTLAALAALAGCAQAPEPVPPAPAGVPEIVSRQENDTVQPIREYFPRRGITWLQYEGGYPWLRP